MVHADTEQFLFCSVWVLLRRGWKRLEATGING